MTVAIGSREPTNVGAATYPTVLIASTDRRFIKKKWNFILRIKVATFFEAVLVAEKTQEP